MLTSVILEISEWTEYWIIKHLFIPLWNEAEKVDDLLLNMISETLLLKYTAVKDPSIMKILLLSCHFSLLSNNSHMPFFSFAKFDIYLMK